MSNVIYLKERKKSATDQAFKSALIQLLRDQARQIEKGLEYLRLERERREASKNSLGKRNAD